MVPIFIEGKLGAEYPIAKCSFSDISTYVRVESDVELHMYTYRFDCRNEKDMIKTSNTIYNATKAVCTQLTYFTQIYILW